MPLASGRSAASRPMTLVSWTIALGAAVVPFLFGAHAHAQTAFFERSLKGIAVPEPLDLNDYVADREAAIRLGKALFWDVRLGTDGKTACATCHWSSTDRASSAWSSWCRPSSRGSPRW